MAVCCLMQDFVSNRTLRMNFSFVRCTHSFCMITLAALLSSCATSTGDSADSTSQTTKANAITHAASGVVFPEAIGGFRRGNVRMDSPVKGAATSDYRAEKSLGGRITLFLNAEARVISRRGETAATALAKYQASVLRNHPKAKLESSGSDVVYFTEVRPGWNDLGGTELHVAEHGEFLLLYSFSFLAVRRDEWRGHINQFIGAF